MDKYNIIIGILLLMIIFDNKMVEGLTMEVCDIHENKFKKSDYGQSIKKYLNHL